MADHAEIIDIFFLLLYCNSSQAISAYGHHCDVKKSSHRIEYSCNSTDSYKEYLQM